MHWPPLNVLFHGESREEKLFFWSSSLACQRNKTHGRPVPSTPFSSRPSHIITKTVEAQRRIAKPGLAKGAGGGRSARECRSPSRLGTEQGTCRNCRLPARDPGETQKTQNILMPDEAFKDFSVRSVSGERAFNADCVLLLLAFRRFNFSEFRSNG